MILLRLFFEFFKTGLFAVGGGLATIPFLQDMGAATGWFTDADLTTMIAVSESTPGPIGVNMATYVGFQTAGIPGSEVATRGLITPSVLVILIVAGILNKFRQSRTVDAVFKGLRPASTALIAAACVSVAMSIFIKVGMSETLGHAFSIHWLSAALSLTLFLAMRTKAGKKLHPFIFIGIAAILGVVFQL